MVEQKASQGWCRACTLLFGLLDFLSDVLSLSLALSRSLSLYPFHSPPSSRTPTGCAGAGWTLDDANSILTPAVGGNSAVSQKTGIEQIEQLSTYVSYLERQPIGTEPAAAAEMAEKE